MSNSTNTRDAGFHPLPMNADVRFDDVENLYTAVEAVSQVWRVRMVVHDYLFGKLKSLKEKMATGGQSLDIWAEVCKFMNCADELSYRVFKTEECRSECISMALQRAFQYIEFLST